MLHTVLSTTAPTTAIWNNLFAYYLFFGTAAAVIVTGYMVYCIAKNRYREGRETPKFHEEGTWGNWKAVVMTLLVTGSVLGFVEYQTFASINLVVPPQGTDPPLHINVIGRQWEWTFIYPNNRTTTGNLTVPEGQVVILNITSIDVDHSFTIPMLNVAKDAIPGRYNTLWFNATQTGSFTDAIRCKELCGLGHATMTGYLTVVTPAKYAAWYNKTGGSP